MADPSDAGFVCDRCGADINANSDFCPACGALFQEYTVCVIHPSIPAAGVCVICSRAFCKQCGGRLHKVFLCEEHASYEIYEGMARVFGQIDNLQAQLATNILAQAGLHPFLYAPYANPVADISPSVNVRVFGEHTLAEMKVLVPFAEVFEAEKILKEQALQSL